MRRAASHSTLSGASQTTSRHTGRQGASRGHSTGQYGDTTTAEGEDDDFVATGFQEGEDGQGAEEKANAEELRRIMQDNAMTLEQRQRVTDEMNSRISNRVKQLVATAQTRFKGSETDVDQSSSSRYSVIEARRVRDSKKQQQEDSRSKQQQRDEEVAGKDETSSKKKQSDEGAETPTGSQDEEGARQETSEGGEEEAFENELNKKRIRTGYLTGETNYNYGSAERMSAVAEYRNKCAEFSKPRMGVLIEQVNFSLDDPPFKIPVAWILKLLGWRVELAKRHVPERFRPSRKKFLRVLESNQVQATLLDLFWFVYCHIFQADTEYSQEILLQSIGKSHIKLHSWLSESNPKMFDVLPFVLANGVFLSFWYGVPGSRAHFDAAFKLRIAMIVSRIMTGMELTAITVMSKMEECFPDDLPRPPPTPRRRGSVDSTLDDPDANKNQRRSSVASAMEAPVVAFKAKQPEQSEVDDFYLPASEIDFPVKYTTEEERELLGYRDTFRVELLRSLPEELLIPAANQATALTYILEKNKKQNMRSTSKLSVAAQPQEEYEKLQQSSLGPPSFSSLPGSPESTGQSPNSTEKSFKELHDSRKAFGPFGSGNRRGGGGKTDEDDIDSVDKFNIGNTTNHDAAMHLLRKRTKKKELTTSFSLTDTGALVQRTLPPGKSLTGGRSYTVKRYVPVPWAHVGDLSTVRTRKPRVETAQNIFDSQTSIKRKLAQTRKSCDERCFEYRDDQREISKQVLFDKSVAKEDIGKTALDIQLRKSRGQSDRQKMHRRRRLDRVANSQDTKESGASEDENSNKTATDGEGRLLEIESENSTRKGSKASQALQMVDEDPLNQHISSLPQPHELMMSKLLQKKSSSTSDLAQSSYRIVSGKLRRLAPIESEDDKQKKEEKMMNDLRRVALGHPGLRVSRSGTQQKNQETSQ
eukprot:gb/GECG01003080.1/.p1 GENE.gb/GECG01003080.1/~~gb/GECG01003080.1/.p1  ORF type:complete len:928 (+),score=172.41 gb/GECG01003080.1/:1-2784(+)